MPCREPIALRGAPVRPLLKKELRELVLGRGFWAALVISGLLSGYSYVQAVTLYGQASQAAVNSPEFGRGLSPLDGILVPTFGGMYLVSSLLFPFVVIRTIAAEKQAGAFQLLVQLPYSAAQLLAAKLAAAIAAWAVLIGPSLVAAGVWKLQGGHLGGFETANLIVGHFLFALVIAGVSLVAASTTQSAASASIAAIGVTLGFWVLDFAAAGEQGLLKDMSGLSLTRVLKSFEAGVFSLALVIGSLAAAAGLTALAGVWLRPDWSPLRKTVNSLLVLSLTALATAGAAQIRFFRDAAEDRRNSFSRSDEALLRTLDGELLIRVYLAASDPRLHDLERSLFARLKRTVRRVSVVYEDIDAPRFAPSDDDYGKVVYSYEGRQATSRSTSEEEVLPLVLQLAGLARKPESGGAPYPGYPLVVSPRPAEVLYYYVLPAAVFGCWAVASGAWRIFKIPRPRFDSAS